mmetsp:Transcript_41076/g.98368  ORF Transcript_41076/g.98368 Transcript_41076/m.98368 type:complete len:201 (+) Transcript_41076:545-1147(+)
MGEMPWLLHQSRAPSSWRALSSGLMPFLVGSMPSSLLNSPVGSVVSSFCPEVLSQLRALSRSDALSSGLRLETPDMETLSKPGRPPSKDGPACLDLTQSSAPSISLALSSRLCPFFLGRRPSSFLNSPVGSRRSLLSPLDLIQLRASLKSLPLCSGVRLETGIDPSSLNLSMMSSSMGEMPWLLHQSSAPSSWRALSSSD